MIFPITVSGSGLKISPAANYGGPMNDGVNGWWPLFAELCIGNYSAEVLGPMNWPKQQRYSIPKF
jgi:hypothetical protein